MAAGLKVTAVRPDGTVITESRENQSFAGNAALTDQPKLRDAREKLGTH
jgi:hypothetical protein